MKIPDTIHDALDNSNGWIQDRFWQYIEENVEGDVFAKHRIDAGTPATPKKVVEGFCEFMTDLIDDDECRYQEVDSDDMEEWYNNLRDDVEYLRELAHYFKE